MGIGPITSISLTHMRHASGTALGQMGLLQFIVTAFVSFMVGAISDTPATSMFILGIMAIVIAYVFTWLGASALRKNPAPSEPKP